MAEASPGYAQSPAAAVEYQRPITNKINQTGQPISLPIQLKDGTRVLGEVAMRIEADDSVFVPYQPIAEKIGPLLAPPARARLAKLTQTDGRVSLAAMEAAELGMRFDPSSFELAFDPSATQRVEGELSVGRLRGSLSAEPTAEPAKVSGYLNVIAGADQSWATRPGQPSQSSGRLDLQGAARLRGVVLETEGSYDGIVDSARCNAETLCAYQHKEGFKRRGSRIVYDRPEDQLRLQLGDTQTDTGGTFLRGIDTLGVSLEKSASKLAPHTNIRSVGRSTVRIERQSEVDVIVNGAVVQHFTLRPGTYNLRDLPFTSGANEVELAITDDAGERKTLAFSTFFDGNLLASGETEWSLAGGAASYQLDGDRKYDMGTKTGAALLRHGITDDVTMEVSAQADMQVATGSVGLFLQSPAGVFGVQPAASTTSGKIGVGGRVSWSAAGFRGSFGFKETLQLSADYRDTNFRVPGDKIDLATQVYRPQALYKLRLTGSHTIALPNDLTATLSARYQFDNPEATSLSRYVIRGDRYGADLTLSKPLAPWMSASILAGYSNETYLHGFAADFNNAKPEFRAAARLFIRPAERTSISASYDTLNKAAQVSASQTVNEGLETWDTSVSGQRIGESGNTTGNASIGYAGNRAEVRLSHASGFDRLQYPTLRSAGEDERTGVRVGTAIAFADGVVAVGPPIRGGAFAIVKPHASIADKTVTVGSGESMTAKTDRFGPALVSNLPAYSNSNVPVDAEDLPVGYSLGAGSYDLRAPYKSGYVLEVGSDYSVTAFGTLLDAAGQPLPLQSGVASPAADPKKHVTVFTNASGRFGADGLSPGRWTIKMESAHGLLVYTLDIPADTQGLFKAETLRPSGAVNTTKD